MSTWGLVALMIIESPRFAYGEPIPVLYTCDGQDRSPALVIAGVPPAAQSLVLLLEDPDAPVGTFTHWVVYDINPDQVGLPEGVAQDPETVEFKQGQTSFGSVGYGGPCPPSNHGPHRYFFRLYALDLPSLDLPPGAPAEAVREVLEGHVLEEAEWMGTYERH